MKTPKRIKLFVFIACLCFVLCIASFSVVFSDYHGFRNGDGPTDSTLLTSHPEDFTSEIDLEVLSQFENHDTLLKIYRTLDNQWYLSDALEDFSQVVTTEIRYIYPGNKNQGEQDSAYSTYMINETGNLKWLGTAYHSSNPTTPVGLENLTHEKIQADLSSIKYEDYIVTYSNRLYIAFVWVRTSAEDYILTYPVRPEFTGLEVGGIYTLEEVQEILKDSNNK